jgi:hypothetical protein
MLPILINTLLSGLDVAQAGHQANQIQVHQTNVIRTQILFGEYLLIEIAIPNLSVILIVYQKL